MSVNIQCTITEYTDTNASSKRWDKSMTTYFSTQFLPSILSSPKYMVLLHKILKCQYDQNNKITARVKQQKVSKKYSIKSQTSANLTICSRETQKLYRYLSQFNLSSTRLEFSILRSLLKTKSSHWIPNINSCRLTRYLMKIKICLNYNNITKTKQMTSQKRAKCWQLIKRNSKLRYKKVSIVKKIKN